MAGIENRHKCHQAPRNRAGLMSRGSPYILDNFHQFCLLDGVILGHRGLENVCWCHNKVSGAEVWLVWYYQYVVIGTSRNVFWNSDMFNLWFL